MHELKETALNDAPTYFILERPCPFGAEKQNVECENCLVLEKSKSCSEEETDRHFYHVLEVPCNDNSDETLGTISTTKCKPVIEREIQPMKIDNNSDNMAVETACSCLDKVKFLQNECAHYQPKVRHEQDETDDFEVNQRGVDKK